MSWYFLAFKRVASCRNMNGQIPYTDMIRFAEANRVPADQVEDFVGCMEMFDELVMAWDQDVKQAMKEANGDDRAQ